MAADPDKHHATLVAAHRALEQARRDRDRAIVAASQAGLTRRAVGDAVGLTAGRVQQILAAIDPNHSTNRDPATPKGPVKNHSGTDAL